jgi:NAD(P)-dependent dehydrogenase (short-subunit alcohol dehydrogenase family)
MLITGASTGIAGELGGDDRAIAARCDVTSYADQEALVERANHAFGRIDAVFANAGFGGSCCGRRISRAERP